MYDITYPERLDDRKLLCGHASLRARFFTRKLHYEQASLRGGFYAITLCPEPFLKLFEPFELFELMDLYEPRLDLGLL